MHSPSFYQNPVVISINSQYPGGGAGISADIETLSSLGCHCSPIITQLAISEEGVIKDRHIPPTTLLIEQLRSVLEDISVDLISINELADISQIEAIHTIISDYPRIPIVFNPRFSKEDDDGFIDALSELLLPEALIAILSKQQGELLHPGSDSIAALAQELISYGSEYLLLTHSEEKPTRDKICNQLFSHRGFCQQYQWQRLNNRFQGAGCTLSAALSAYLAHDFSMNESVQQAQVFTFKALEKSRRIGMGALVPDRMHWAK